MAHPEPAPRASSTWTFQPAPMSGAAWFAADVDARPTPILVEGHVNAHARWAWPTSLFWLFVRG